MQTKLTPPCALVFPPPTPFRTHSNHIHRYILSVKKYERFSMSSNKWPWFIFHVNIYSTSFIIPHRSCRTMIIISALCPSETLWRETSDHYNVVMKLLVFTKLCYCCWWWWWWSGVFVYMCACACVSFVLTYNGLENSSATSTKQESLHYARNILKIWNLSFMYNEIHV